MNGDLEVGPIHPLHPDALQMIGESEAELASIYPPEVRFAFSPQELVEAGVHFLLARRVGAPVGCGGVAPLDGYGELKRMFVTKPARGTGVAQAILSGLEAIARDLGLPLLRLETGEDSPDALAFYAKSGFVRRGPFGEYRENGSSVFMEKRL